jgi:hypothetical protein
MSPIDSNKLTRNSFIFVVIVVIVVIILVLELQPMTVVFVPIDITKVTQLLLSLILVSLFWERALEVFISTWRGPTTDSLQSKVLADQNLIIDLGKIPNRSSDEDNLLTATRADLKSVNSAFTEYSSITKRYALWSSFIMGLVISLVGIRTLITLVTPESYAALSVLQKNLFTMVDVLVTGGLIAGGSDGIHKILQTFLDLMDKTSRNINAGTGSPAIK